MDAKDVPVPKTPELELIKEDYDPIGFLREIFKPIFKHRGELHDRDKIEENVDSQNKEEIMLKAYVQINEAGNGIDILEEGQNIPNTLVMSIEEAIKFAKENNKVFYPSGVDEVDQFINYMVNN